MCGITFDLSYIERSRSLRFGRLISPTGLEQGQMLLLNKNRKSYLGSPIPASHLTLSDLDRSELWC